MNFDDLKTRLRLPVVAAPMLLVSGPDLVIAAGQAGILGAFPALNARSTDQLKGWLEKIEGTLDEQPYAVNLIIQGPGAPRFADDLRLLEAIKRSEEHTSELQSLIRNSYDVFCLKQKTDTYN